MTPAWVWPACATAVAVAALLLQLHRIAEAPAGFHSMNEGFYHDLAARQLEAGWLSPLTKPLIPGVPPLLPLLMMVGLWLGGLAGVRMVSILATLAATLLVYRLGVELRGRRTGLLAAAVFGLAPGVVLIGRNAQADALMVCLLLAATLAYVIALRHRSWRMALLAGAALGAGMLVKLPVALGALALGIWQLWSGRHDRRDLRVGLVALGVAAGVSVPWFAYHAIANGSFLAAQGALASAASGGQPFSGEFLVTRVLGEYLAMLFAPFAVVSIIGLIDSGRRREPADRLVLSGAATFLGFYLVFHFHSYYLLPVAPFGALAAALLLDRVTESVDDRAVLAVAAAIAIVAAGASVGMLSAKKWGHWGPADIASDAKRLVGRTRGVRVAVASEIVQNQFGPGLDRFASGVRVSIGDTAPVAVAGERSMRLVMLRPDSAPPGYIGPAYYTRYRPVLFGWAVDIDPGGLHTMATGPVSLAYVGGPLRFGLDPVRLEHPKWAYFE